MAVFEFYAMPEEDQAALLLHHPVLTQKQRMVMVLPIPARCCHCSPRRYDCHPATRPPHIRDRYGPGRYKAGMGLCTV